MKKQTKEMTPLQKLIEWIEHQSEQRHMVGDVLTTPDIIAKATQLLPEERKAIEDAVDSWVVDGNKKGKDYFTEKYGQ